MTLKKILNFPLNAIKFNFGLGVGEDLKVKVRVMVRG